MLRSVERANSSVDAVPILPTTMLRIGDRSIFVEVASDDTSRALGLSYRDALGDGRGMLFDFPSVQGRSFWMNGMKFPLDILFLRDQIVIDVHANVPPPSQTSGVPKIIRSKEGADQVLEINAGKSAEWGIVEGMRIEVADLR